MKSLPVFAFLAWIHLLTAQTYPESSNLPLVIIDTKGRSIPDDPKIDAWMKIVDHGPERMNRPADVKTEHDGHVGIGIGGAFSSTFPQKPYEIETRNASGNNMNVSLH